MKDNKTAPEDKRILEKTLDSITVRREAPASVFILLIILYIAASIVVSVVAGAKGIVLLAGNPIPIYAFAGVFSSLSNICVILLVVYCGKPGFFTSIAALLIQLSTVSVGIFMRHNFTSLPGVFVTLLTMIAISVIYVNNKKLEKNQIKLRDQAVTDMLTGLPNRFACSELVANLTRRGEKYAAVSIDLNGFKSINDTMGFNTGNKVLIEIASRWKRIADSGLAGTLDFIARLSGDEFALVIRNYHSEEDIINTIREYETALSSQLTIDECDFYITASFGYAEFPGDADNVDLVFNYANAAMQAVKSANSSNHILRFTPELLKKERTIEVEAKIRAALEHDTIFFHLQPQYDMDHKLRGFEALARMKDDNGNVISPGEFIPVAEKVGLIDQVDGAVYRKSAMFFGELIKKTGADITLSINASVRHLMKSDFLDEIGGLLESSGIPPRQLEIEITESIMIDSMDKALRCIDEIKKMGIQIAIDDFGTGYSSLSYLNSFPANLLKIDKSFIDKMNTNDSSRQYVAAIISIGHILGFDVISEGVEDQDQIDTLRSIGCDYIQGFIWGRPLPQEEAEKIVLEVVQKQ